MSEVEIKGLKEVQDFFDKLPGTLASRAKDRFKKEAADRHADILQEISSKLNTRSGELKNSFQYEITGSTLDSLKAVHTSDSEYFVTHEFGAKISAKNKYMGVPGGPYLNIPTEGNLTYQGLAMMSPQEVFNSGGYIAGRGVYLNGVMMFSLAKSVTVPKRLNVLKLFEDGAATLLGSFHNVLGGL